MKGHEVGDNPLLTWGPISISVILLPYSMSAGQSGECGRVEWIEGVERIVMMLVWMGDGLMRYHMGHDLRFYPMYLSTCRVEWEVTEW